MKNQDSDIALQRTKSAFLWTRILNTPFWAVFSMLPFILYKDLHATPLQVAVFIALKPLVSIFSAYWSAAIKKRRDRLLPNVMWSNLLKIGPFLFFPFIDNPWFLILSSGLYMMLHRGGVPAWMEILKLNLPGATRERVFAYGTSIGYLGDGILPFVLGWLLDGYVESWRWIFPVVSLISLIAVYHQARIPIPQSEAAQMSPSPSLKTQLIEPWESAKDLIMRRPDFTRFQFGFMLLGGGGLMIMQPVLPAFFMDVLKLSYTELAIALTLCKGIGCALTSSYWARLMNQVNIYRFSGWVTALGCLFPVCLLAAQFHIVWLYLAYIGYGIMQAGSELSWNLSGPVFSKEEDSSAYSSSNVLLLGLRGAFVPALGSILCMITHSAVEVLALGGILCLAATLWLSNESRAQAKGPAV